MDTEPLMHMESLVDTKTLGDYIRTEILNDPDAIIEPEDDLLLTGTLDSIGVTRLVEHIETDLDITIPIEDITLENFQTLARIVDYLSELTG